ncbi:MAG: hypothetical protein CMJ89_09240 [Planctomycetes bacterium]|nr:hypothetical protein [Planctomycetota bacterium]
MPPTPRKGLELEGSQGRTQLERRPKRPKDIAMLTKATLCILMGIPLGVATGQKAQLIRAEGGLVVEGRTLASPFQAPLGGAQLLVLTEGVEVVASVPSDESGFFEFTLPEGTYDVRALAPGFLAQTLRDVVVERGNRRELVFNLTSVGEALTNLGIEPWMMVDTDRDHLSDDVEIETGSNPDLADSNGDGVQDALSAWTSGRETDIASSASPHLDTPLRTIAGATAPLPLFLRHVPGATGYRLELVKPSTLEVLYTDDFDFVADGFVLGNEAALAWVPPDLEEGYYELRVQAWSLFPERKLGSVHTLGVESVEHELEAVEIGAPEVEETTMLEGQLSGSEIVIRSGARIRVPVGRTLSLVASGNIVIEAGAEIIGESGNAEEPAGTSLELFAGGDLVISGILRAGNGRPGGEIEPHGGVGGRLVCAARGAVKITRTARIASGNGGAGHDATRESLRSGGYGGGGGNLALFASELRVADRPALIEVGGGGDGGHGNPGGCGGDCGDVWLTHWDLLGDGYVALSDPSYPLSGGVGGATGNTLALTQGSGVDDVTPNGRNGARGWLFAGSGQSVSASAPSGGPGAAGGEAFVQSGEGGDLTPIGVTASALGLRFGFIAHAGDGGTALATGGKGGAAQRHRGPGPGGAAFAIAGRGGHGLLRPSPFFTIAGDGGRAIATGGNGSNGISRCGRRGGRGSRGGAAEAVGGPGGNGFFFAGDHGSALATGGKGGRGGSGRPPGQGGRGGSAAVGAHARGLGTWIPRKRPRHRFLERYYGARGARGSYCGGR